MSLGGWGNAVAAGSGHSWTLGGDVRTETGALGGRLSFKLTGSSFSGALKCVDGYGRLGVARFFFSFFFFFYLPSLPRLYFSGDFLCCRRARNEGAAREDSPRIAGSVSTNATDTQGRPRGTGLVPAGIAQLFQPLFDILPKLAADRYVF